MKKSSKTEIKSYYECEICKINSFTNGERMIPCPRGSCEAELKGEIIITTEVKLYKAGKQI